MPTFNNQPERVKTRATAIAYRPKNDTWFPMINAMLTHLTVRSTALGAFAPAPNPYFVLFTAYESL